MHLVYVIGAILVSIVYADIKLDSASESLNKFALKFLAEISRSVTSDTNLAISPYTVWTAMSVLSEGARGYTARELEATLGIPSSEFTRQQFRKLQEDIVKNLTQKQDGVTLEILNSVFMDDRAKLNGNFRDLVKKVYDVEVVALNFFNSPKTTKYINEKLSTATHGRVQEIITEDAVINANMLITSALFFKGMWDLKFNKGDTEERPFYRENREIIGIVPMMFNSGTFPFSRILQNQATAVELPYVGERMSMIAILPHKGESLSSVLQTLSETPIGTVLLDLQRARQMFNESEVKVFMPRFKITSDLKLQEVLKNMGIRHAFSQQLADLTGISPTSQLFVSRVLHKAEIQVDEDGTEGSAVTVIEVTDRIISPTFNANRPFAFFIIDKLTHTIVFMGKVTNPKRD